MKSTEDDEGPAIVARLAGYTVTAHGDEVIVTHDTGKPFAAGQVSIHNTVWPSTEEALAAVCRDLATRLQAVVEAGNYGPAGALCRALETALAQLELWQKVVVPQIKAAQERFGNNLRADTQLLGNQSYAISYRRRANGDDGQR